MKAVPWWFQTTANVLAVVFAVWVGLHYRAPHATAWFVIYGAIAAVTAAIPAHRVVGIAGLLVGVAVMASGAYLMKGAGAAISVRDVFAMHGGVVSPSREAMALVIATAWLMLGSGFRLLRA